MPILQLDNNKKKVIWQEIEVGLGDERRSRKIRLLKPRNYPGNVGFAVVWYAYRKRLVELNACFGGCASFIATLCHSSLEW